MKEKIKKPRIYSIFLLIFIIMIFGPGSVLNIFQKEKTTKEEVPDVKEPPHTAENQYSDQFQSRNIFVSINTSASVISMTDDFWKKEI